jgi:hypothetical protein
MEAYLIYWNQYKVLKQMAERHIKNEDSLNDDIQIEVLKFKLNKISKEQCIENIINVLSNGEHFKK